MSFAILKDNKVSSIVTEFPEYSVEMVIDISNMMPVPRIGWILSGNKLVSDNAEKTQSELKLEQQIHQQEFGMSLSLTLVNMMGGRNLLLTEQGTSVNVSSLLSSLGTAKALLETGGLKTARGYINAVSAGFPLHADILSFAVIEITAFLGANGYE